MWAWCTASAMDAINFFDGYPPELSTTRDTVSLPLEVGEAPARECG